MQDAVDLLLADLRALESRIRSCSEQLSIADEGEQRPLLEELEDALDAHPGAVVTVTHDRHWIRRASGARRVRVRSGGGAEVVG